MIPSLLVPPHPACLLLPTFAGPREPAELSRARPRGTVVRSPSGSTGAEVQRDEPPRSTCPLAATPRLASHPSCRVKDKTKDVVFSRPVTSVRREEQLRIAGGRAPNSWLVTCVSMYLLGKLVRTMKSTQTCNTHPRPKTWDRIKEPHVRTRDLR